MPAKFQYTPVDPKDVTVPSGTFTAEQGHVYEVRGRDVVPLRDDPDFTRVDITTEAEAPTWQSPS